MEIRQAILRAADQIQGHPELWNYWKIHTPSCGTPGCAIGWIAAMRGVSGFVSEVCAAALGIDAEEFYERMRSKPIDCPVSIADAPKIAAGLRAYADKYHPAPVKEPDWNALAMAPLPVAERQCTVT
jgi:hypothetical protein